jgi:hypothetical protein
MMPSRDHKFGPRRRQCAVAVAAPGYVVALLAIIVREQDNTGWWSVINTSAGSY